MPKKILLVDDSSTTLLMEQMILKNYTKYESGCTDYITKPINCRELVALIHSHLERSKAPAPDIAKNSYHMTNAIQD